MNGLLAQATDEELVSFFDNTWHEQYRFSFGEWIDQFVRWGVNNPVTSVIGEIVKWPFSTFFDLIMSNRVGRDSITTIPWVWVVIAVFVIASFTRNTRIGLACAGMLSVCGFLGAQYWEETAQTIGLILVSVTLCAIVGIPLGILSGRFDAIWNVVRPTLDAMQVVHSFVFMLPFIFFFGIGNISATMVTMVFALPPLVRLTNLGIRQVPEDVVEASRAYGATELRVLTDVQLPLARPAIMTGLNQTLLLAISMLGIAALMGAGGLGRLLFRAINNLDLGLAASAGLAFFLVAVVLDRISQTEAQDGVGLLTKIRQAWAYRANPAGLLEVQADQALEPEDDTPAERQSPVEAPERMGLLLAAAGGTLAIVSTLLAWSSNAGLISSWSRRADEDLPGLDFSGLSASGGSWFGWFTAILGLFVVLAALRPMFSMNDGILRLLSKGQGVLLAGIAAVIAIIWVWNTFIDTDNSNDFSILPTIALVMFIIAAALIVIETYLGGTPRLGADGILIAGIAMLSIVLGFLWLQPSAFISEDFSRGIGVTIALVAALLVTAGGLVATGRAPYGPRRPLPVEISWGRVIAASFALLLIVGSAIIEGDDDTSSEFGWFFDARVESLITPEFLEEMEAIEAEAGDDINKQLAAAQTITNAYNSLENGETIVHTGFSEGGPQLGWLAVILSGLAVLAAIPAAGLLGGGDTRRWQGSVLMSGLGLGIMGITMAFMISMIRVADSPKVLAGIGAFLTFVAGFVVFASGRSVVNEFRRRKVYRDVEAIEARAAEALLNLDEVDAATVPV